MAPAELFTIVVEEVARVLGVSAVLLDRYEGDSWVTVLASTNVPGFPTGSRWPLDGPSLAASILETGRPARFDDYATAGGTMAATVRRGRFRSTVGVPIVVDGALWGLLCIASTSDEPVRADAEPRLRDFTELVAIAVSNTESRDGLRRLAQQQTSLRRVATLVAEGASPAELFAAVAEEVARILDVSLVTVARYEAGRAAVVLASVNAPGFPVGSRWPLDGPSLFASVLSTGAPARIDDYSGLPGPVAASARACGVHSGLGVPIVVDGSVWGMMAVGRKRRREALPGFAGTYTGRLVFSTESAADVQARLVAFTDLVATAISKAQAHDELRRLADEQAALRRVATLVAEAAPAGVIFAAVAEEVASILELQRIEVVRYGADGSGTVVGSHGDHPFAAGSRWPLDGPSIMRSVFRTSRPARIDDYEELPGTIADVARAAGFRSAIGAPIIVDGRTWGTIIAISTLPDPIPEESEIRLSHFTELAATAVSNATARAELIASRARIVAAGDEARRRFERNLHDGTQQRLIALRLDLERIRETIPDGEGTLRSGLEDAERNVESVLDEVREVARGLHPSQLARGGLGPALRALAARSPIGVALSVEVEDRPPAALEVAVYYVASEALANAAKHSGASAISVNVVRDQAYLRATIADDGAGGAVAEAGSGLAGLTDRVEALGGRFLLASTPGAGTTISIELPLGVATP